MTLVQIDTGYACAGVVVESGVVTEAAPIFRWMVGKDFESVRNWRKIKMIRTIPP